MNNAGMLADPTDTQGIGFAGQKHLKRAHGVLTGGFDRLGFWVGWVFHMEDAGTGTIL